MKRLAMVLCIALGVTPICVAIPYPYTISGQVTVGGSGLDGVTITFDDGITPLTEVTSGGGYYSHTVGSGWTGTVSASLSAYSFSPNHACVGPVTANTTQDFTATPQHGTIIVEKQTDPDGASDSFTFNGDVNGSIADGGQIIVANLPPGTYTSQEIVPAGWTLISITLDDGASATPSSGDINTGVATFQLDPGETVKAVFYNNLSLDYGDAPDSYGTLLASDGARHIVGPGCNLGPVVDTEGNGQPTVAANGDDVSGAPDDEDGVILPPVLTTGTTATVSVDGGPSGGMLDAWIDFNGNGVFDHPTEHLWSNASQPLSSGANNLTFPVPIAAVPGPTYARFRLSNVGGLAPTGFAPDGEVEDYQVEIEARPPMVIYVDEDATGANDGTSWADAFNYLQDGLGAAGPGDEIRVAEGTYRPDEDTLNPDGTGDMYVAFELINGVDLYGGYAGVGHEDPNARDPKLYETILSGDLDGNDVSVSKPGHLLDEPSLMDNSFHVVVCYGDEDVLDDLDDIDDINDIYDINNFNPADGSTIIDGFTITGGLADDGDIDAAGAGILNIVASPTINNCVFKANAAGLGGGLANVFFSNPKVANCTFTGNAAILNGAGMANVMLSSPTVINCTFTRNTALIRGGAIANTLASSPSVTNCTFSINTAIIAGGAISSSLMSSPTITNCTFSENRSVVGGGAIATFTASNPTVTNSILWENSPNQIRNWNAATTVNYSDIQGGWPGIGNIDTDPLFVRYPDDGGTGWGDDPCTPGVNEAEDDDFGDLRLTLGSPCIDAGDNSAVPAGVAFDLDGNNRFFNDPHTFDTGIGSPPIVDMGAYESIAIAPSLIVETLEATDIGQHQATLWGRMIDDLGQACQYRFYYWKTGDMWVSMTGWTGSVRTGETFSQILTGLTPDSEYYFWAEAKNSQGRSDGWASGLKKFETLTNPVEIYSPDGGECLLAGSTQIVRWGANPTISEVMLEYSLDKGGLWNVFAVLANNDPNKECPWVVPNVDSAQCLVRVCDFADPNTWDNSDGVFTITTYVVPDVVGMSKADAEASINAAGLTVGTITYSYTAGMHAGKVMNQNPPKNTPVPGSSAVDLVISIGPEATAKPVVKTESTTDIGPDTATLCGTITNAGGGACEYRFCYWKQGDMWITNTVWMGYASQGETFSHVLTGLTPGTQYWYWVEAKNTAGRSDGWSSGLRSFTTQN